MKNVFCFGFLCLSVSLAALSHPLAVGQLPVPSGGNATKPVQPRQPGGRLGDQLGVYLTIEGVRSEGAKVETGTLLVDTVDGKKLEQPIPLVIRGAIVADHNLQPAHLSLPAQRRCILRGYESGEMIGVPSAVLAAAKEQGWEQVPQSPVAWQWRPYFNALVVVEPQDLELRQY
ncbi:MAG: hypothetical protein SFX18_03900 [Pirellulales bacterium]|nr:hypothetical protein [Pirellulales bacterium]